MQLVQYNELRLSHRIGALALVAALAGPSTLVLAEAERGKIPVTAASDEARKLYMEGRAQSDRLRLREARRLYEEAVSKDPTLAQGYLDLANTSGTPKEFFDALKKAVALKDKVTEGERLMIVSFEDVAKGDVSGQESTLTKLVGLYPDDERVRVLLANFYFGQQNYEPAIREYTKAAALAPSFTQTYNQLGYSYRFLGRFKEAEVAFQKYIELLPDDPNPYDSYAELLMKMGRFEDSIKNYERALSIDQGFTSSYVGIGNDRVFMGQGEAARASYARLAGVARNDGERRQALFWSALSYVDEGASDKALAEVEKMAKIAEAANDWAAVSGDLNLAGNVLLEAGETVRAEAKFDEAVKAMDKADVPAEVKAATRRTDLYDRARLALAKNDVKSARAKLLEYAGEVKTARSIPFEVRRQHELEARVALAEQDFKAALADLGQASQQDPRVLFLTAVALKGAGDGAKARQAASLAADFNELNGNYAYVRTKAKALFTKL